MAIVFFAMQMIQPRWVYQWLYIQQQAKWKQSRGPQDWTDSSFKNMQIQFKTYILDEKSAIGGCCKKYSRPTTSERSPIKIQGNS